VEEFNRIMEENMRILDDSPLVVVLENRGRKQRDIEIAQNMLHAGYDYEDISKMTGLDVDRIAELDSELQARVV